MNRISSLVALCLAPAAIAGAPDNRDIQISAVDFENGTLTLQNFGSSDISLTGWRFCSHDSDEQRRYTGINALSGVTVEAGTTFTVHFNNDAPGGSDSVNRSTLGNFALPLDQDAYSIQIFFPNPDTGTVQFGNAATIADHVQWNTADGTVGSAQSRTAQAVSTGLWTGLNQYVMTQADSLRFDLTDTANGRLHGPGDYSVTNPSGGCNVADVAEPLGTLNIDDVLTFLDAFANEDPIADVAAPAGAFNIDDVISFLNAFASGCP